MTVTLFITTTDRNGRELERIRITHKTKLECENDQAIVWGEFKTRLPDTYHFNRWVDPSNDQLTVPLKKRGSRPVVET